MYQVHEAGMSDITDLYWKIVKQKKKPAILSAGSTTFLHTVESSWSNLLYFFSASTCLDLVGNSLQNSIARKRYELESLESCLSELIHELF